MVQCFALGEFSEILIKIILKLLIVRARCDLVQKVLIHIRLFLFIWIDDVNVLHVYFGRFDIFLDFYLSRDIVLQV